MKQYCRYCSHCIGLDEEHGYCEEKNKMIKKTSIKNACTSFAFCEVDAFYYNRADNPERTDLIETRMIDGRKCLVITVNDHIEVNGICIKE